MSVFGFNTQSSAGGDFLPIVKYDSRSGMMFRMDRNQDASGNYSTDQVEITDRFKAMVDLENIETGWIDFAAGSAPSFTMITMRELGEGVPFPDRPSPNHKNGVRFLIKLAKDCADGQPAIREMAGTSKSLLSGVEALYVAYLKDRDANKGKLPAVILEKRTPVKTGTGTKSSTNYHPTFKIVGWAPRGDLVHTPRNTQASAQNGAQTSANGAQTSANGAAPSTGAQRAAPPVSRDAISADDFG